MSCFILHSNHRHCLMDSSSSYAPLRERVLVGHGPLTTTDTHTVPSRPLQYKGWTQESMTLAVKSVIEDGISVRKAAEHYGVPKSTLGDRISGRVLPGAKSGPTPYLNREEEEELVRFLCRSALVGHGRTRKEVLAIVSRVLLGRGSQQM